MSKTFDNLMRALMEVKAHREGRIELPSVRIEIDMPYVREIRKKLKLSQEKFAGLFGFSLSRQYARGNRRNGCLTSARHTICV